MKSTSRAEPPREGEPDAREVQRMKQREPTQHDLLKQKLPKEDLADGLEAFDGDEA